MIAPCMSVDRSAKTPSIPSPFRFRQQPDARTSVFNLSAAVLKRRPTYFMIQMQDVMSKPMPDFREGSIIKGQILEVRPREVLVDVGYKSEGVIPLNEFEDPESLQVGDEVDVLLERLENEEGMVVLSKEKAAYRQNWYKIVTVFQGDGLIKGKVRSVVKGGLMVNIGVETSKYKSAYSNSDRKAPFRAGSGTRLPRCPVVPGWPDYCPFRSC